MKILSKSFVSLQRFFHCSVCAVLFTAIVSQSEAAIYNLTDGDSSVVVNDAQGSGRAYDWTSGGVNVNQLNNQWYYYRIGTTGQEYPIDSISAPVSTPDLDGKGVTTTYSDATKGISVRIYFTLADSLNPGQSQFNQAITVNNLSSTSQSITLFQYSDFNLGGDANDQSVQFTSSRNVAQTDGDWTLTENALLTGSTALNEVALSPGILSSLTDINTTTLNNNTYPGPLVGPGDLTFAYQWTKTVAAGGSFGGSALERLTLVPEPSSLALIVLGGVFLAGMKRRRAI